MSEIIGPTHWHESFWSHVNKNDRCWEWVGHKNTGGYGHFYIYRSRYFAHRLSFELAHGPIPAGVLICHHCDNPGCVNPSHLYAGSPKSNSADAVKRDRLHRWNGARRGQNNPSAKLSDADILDIHQLRAGGLSMPKIAKRYNTSSGGISDILSGKTWSHLHPDAALQGDSNDG